MKGFTIKGNNALAASDAEMAVKLDPQNEDYRELLEELRSGRMPSAADIIASM